MKIFDIVFLDENMPGINGLAALQRIKEIDPTLPVVMITKSEEEHIMEDAIGSKISDYLIKPVNPNQILLSLKKNLDERRLVSEKTTSDYRQEFREISMRLGDRMDAKEWTEFYRKMVHWSMELSNLEDEGMTGIFQAQQIEANEQFSKFIKNNYLSWLKNTTGAPTMSHTLVKDKVLPILKKETESVFMVVIDNLRFDQWRTIQPKLKEFFRKLKEFFRVEEEELFYSILPTATHYARNAIFAGLMPSEIEKLHPNLWLNEDDEGGKNMHTKGEKICMRKN